ncbi:restriction endonuclease [Streptomyces similanensis]|uniref:Restriction endonuclease type IV Mrr domain-containing protein n=1 Tax=Streptomyces similanensis TaxID=1274988 RepID=A0ABP9LSK9_9ACTN
MVTEGDSEPKRPRSARHRWREYEQEVATLVDSLDAGTAVQHNRYAVGRISGVRRQLDAVVEGHLAGQHVCIVIEAKLYKRSVSIGTIDEFIGKMLDVGCDRGVLYAAGGFTDGRSHARATLGTLRCVLLTPSIGPVATVHRDSHGAPDVMERMPNLAESALEAHLNVIVGYNRTAEYEKWVASGHTMLYRQHQDRR